MKHRLTILLTVLAVWGALFGKALTSSEVFAFRDAAHFYFPLFSWTSNQIGGGNFPLWNPYDSLGIPHFADCTSSVLYPGKIVFLLPIPYTNQYALFVSSHVLLAAWGAYRLAKRWKCTTLASGVSSLSYAFGGIVIFQYCNIPYMISAAWLPFAASAAYEMVRRRRFRHATKLGLSVSLMILGGDPHTAYNVALASLALVCLAGRSHLRVSRHGRRRCARQTTAQSLLSGWMSVLLVAGVACFAFAAVQLIPTIQWAKSSHRTAWESPRSVYELCQQFAQHGDANDDLPAPLWQGIFGDPKQGVHAAKTFEFSIGPWRWLELVWPNLGGEQFPISRRWMNRIPAEGRVWTPSLYMGLLPCILAASVWRLRRGPLRWKWAAWLVLLGLLACLGRYGLGWIAAEVLYATGRAESLWIGPQVGGLYWLFTVFFPGYAAVRYPAKIAVFVALGISLLAGKGWDEVWSSGRGAARRLLIVSMIVSVFFAGVSLVFCANILDLLAGTPTDSLFGPIDSKGALSSLQVTFAQAFCISIVSYGLLSTWNRSWSSVAAAVLFVITAADLAWSHRWLIPTVDVESALASSTAAEKILSDAAVVSPHSSIRAFRPLDSWYPSEWRNQSSPRRQAQCTQWDVDTLRPRYHMARKIGMVGPSGSIQSQAIRSLLQVATKNSTHPFPNRMPHRSVLDVLGVSYLILPLEISMAAATPLDGIIRPDDARVWRNDRAFPRVWIVHSVEQMPRLKTRRPSAVERRTERVLFPNGKPRDWKREAVIESDESFDFHDVSSVQFDGNLENCQIIRDELDQVHIDVKLAEPGLIVLSDLFCPGWQARIVDLRTNASSGASILQTNRVMRGVFLPAGSFRVEFEYWPRAFSIGAVISGIAWSLWILQLAVNIWVRSRHNRAKMKRRTTQ